MQTRAQLLAQIEDLQERLREADETLHAIRRGEVDAVVVAGDEGDQIFTLQGADRPYRKLIEQMNEGAAILSIEGLILFSNARFAEMLRTPLDKVIGMPLVRLIASADRANFESSLSRQTPVKVEVRLRMENDAGMPVQLSINRIKPNGTEGVGLVITDLTEQKRAEHSLAASEIRLRSIVDAEPECVKIVDPDGRLLDMNPAGLAMIECRSLAEAQQQPLVEFVAPEHRAAFFDLLQRALRGESGRLEFESVGLHGTRRWLDCSSVPLRDEAGQIASMLSVTRDISQRKAAEGGLQRQANLLNLTHDAIIVRDMQDRITFWNLGAEDRYGWTAAEAIGQVTHLLLQTQFPQPRAQIFDELYAAGRWEGELVHATRDGRTIFVASRWSLERDRRGNPTGILEINNDITGRKAAEEALRASEETLRATGDSALDGIIRLDPEGNVAQWNAAAEKMFGFTSEEILGRNLHETLVPVESRQPYQRGWPQFRQSGQGAVIDKVLELEALRKDGSRFPVEVSVASVLLHGRWNAVGIVRDITQRKRAEADLVAAKSAAESANRSKSEFLANMSHEIRTPMNGVIGLTSLVLDTELSKEQRQYLDGVMLSAEALLKIINDILDFSKIEAGRLELEKLDFDLRETLENTIRTLAVRAHEKGLELLCNVLPEAPDALVGDPARLWQVLVNLVGNAIKFTQEGEVSVTVGVELLSDKEVCLLFTVGDTGIGIPADRAQALFKPFSQVDSSTTRKYGGTGLGLAISAQIVELMKGRIWFESELGKGSKFHFTASFGLRTTSLPKRAPLPPSGLDGLRVLMVDDNATNRMILRNVLTHWGMRPTEAEGGNAALQLLRDAHQADEPFALILLDVMMPVMDGFELLDRIRQMPEISRPVIMMLSSRDEPGDAARARDLGAVAYIVKPIRPSDLLDAIVSTLGISLEAPGAPAPAKPATDAEPRGPSLRLLVAEDNPINQMFAVRVLEKAGHRVAVANNGEEALIAVGRDAFDLVLMDVQMPVMDGFEATALIRQQEKTTGRHLPIVAMTAHAMKGDREKCLEAGMDGYVAKPVQKDELFTAIAAAISSKMLASSK